MKKAPFKTLAAASGLALLLSSPRLLAQDATPAPPPAASASAAASPAGSPSNGDRMEQFRQRMNQRIKEELKATDEEWSVIQPLLEKVQNKMRDANPRGLGGMGRGRPPGGDNGGATANSSPRPEARAPRPGSPETEALKAALASPDTAPADIQAKLTALRDSRKKNLAELEQARQDLVKVLTQRQEATLVMMGVLE